MSKDNFTTNPDGILIDDDGLALSSFVNAFIVQELNTIDATVILLRLFEKGTVAPGQVVSSRAANQVRMTPQSARRLATILNQAADQAEGVGAPKQ